MIQKIKLLVLFCFATTLACVLFNSDVTHATGEKWELIDSTTIRVSGGSFTGPLAGNGFTVDNPRSLTLKLKTAPNTDPSIWEANQSFRLGTVTNGQPSYLEDTARETGQFCVVANNFALLLSGREAASFTPIHREDCNKPFGQMRFIESGNSQYNRCGNWGPIQGTRCNTLWASSQTAALSLDSKISYNIPGKPLVCGDPGYAGACPQPYDPAKADCTKTNGQEGAQRQCEAIKECILMADKAAADCQKAWTDCVASYGAETPNYNSCMSAIAVGDFEGGKKFVADTEVEDKTSCAVEGVGWIVCPVAGFLGMMTDGLFAVLTTLLSFTPVQENGATYETWQAMRNIANAAFVIAFLIIIFSQLTGAGITNYGIKKMVPRLIAAAILVNLSFFICQIAVDLSNILGYSLQSLMTNASKTASGESNNLNVWGELVGWILAGGAVAGTGITATLSIAAAGGWIPALALLLPVLVTVLFAVITVVLVLAARQALIIILIVISPLAFVAYLLPNTEEWFHKWRKLFITLLLMFPIISVIFGGSQLAAAVIRAGTDNPLIYILSLAVQVIPFFLVPIIMKTAGGLLNRFGGMVNNPNKGPFDRLRKRAENYAGYKVDDAASRNLKYKGNSNRFSFAGSARRKAERESIYSSASSRAKEAGVEYIGGRLAPDDTTGNPTDTAFAQKMAGSNDTNAIMMAMARGASAVDEIEAKELKAAQVILSNARVDGENLLALSGGADGKGLNGQTVKGSAIMQMAASASLFAQGRQMDTVVENLLASAHNPNNAADKKRILDFTVGQMQSNYPKAKEKQVALTDEALMKGIAEGNITADNLSGSLKLSAAKKAADLSVEQLASQEKSSMEYIQQGMQSVGADKAAKIRDTSIKVTQTPSAVARTNRDTFGIIEQISRT